MSSSKEEIARREGMSYAFRYELCPHYKVKRLYCDECKEETDKLYKYGEKELCEDCLIKEFEVIESEEN